MSATSDVPPPEVFEPVLPIPPRRGVSRLRRLIVLLAFLIVVVALFSLWFFLHRHLVAMAAISMRGGNVHWELDSGKWKHGGESTVIYNNQGWSAKDDSIASLLDLKHVVSLDLSGCVWVQLSSYAVLNRLPDLHDLSLSRFRELNDPDVVLINDSVLPYIAGHTHLVELSLDGNPITDKGLAALKDLPSLEVIDLSRTEITDAGLQQLLSLPNLKSIRVDDTKVTDAGIAAFVRRRPEIEIIRYNPKTEGNANGY